ncbi:MAG: hypothetical protein QM750_23155 [Rubrivivax sp.]
MKRRRYDPGMHPVRLAMPLSDADRLQAETHARLALAEFESGSRSHQVLRELLLSASMCAALANEGIGPEAWAAGMNAVNALGEDEPDVDCIRAALEALDEQRRMATRGQLIRAAQFAQAALG